jgi:hypothetical protein
VTDETLTIVATDPVIVEAGREALRAVHARAASAPGGAAAGGASPGTDTAGAAGDGEDSAAAAAGEDAPGAEAGGTTATGTVIRGDHPYAAGLANVWLELRKTLNTIADPATRARRVKVAVGPPAEPSPAEPAEEGKPDEPDDPAAPVS